MEYYPAEQHVDDAGHEHRRQNDETELDDEDGPSRRVGRRHDPRRVADKFHWTKISTCRPR